MRQIDAYKETNPTEEEEFDWYTEKIALKDDLMEMIQKVEDWVELPKRDKRVEGQRLKAERVAFFEEKAMSLTPPLTPETLHLIPAYGRAIDIAKPPTERSWKALAPKLEVDRAAAEEMASSSNSGDADVNARLKQDRLDLYYERQNNDSLQQLRVLRVADDVIEAVLNAAQATPTQASSCADTTIDDQDFALIVLKKVWNQFYDDIDQDGTAALGMRLLLDDAIMVYKLKICPVIDDWADAARSKKAKSFKCPGCTRTDVNAKYDFEDLITHLTKHSNKLGDFTMFRKPGPEQMNSVLGGIGLVVEWTRNLPVLATHQTATGKWDPHDETPYHRFQPPNPEVNPPFRLYFNRDTVGPDDIQRGNFAANAIYAAQKFKETKLHAKYKTMIAFKYALFQWYKQSRTEASPEPHLTALDEINVELMKIGEYDLFHGFRCPKCVDASLARLRKFAEKDQSFSDLLVHFKAAHIGENWVKSLMALPSEDELWEKLNEMGQEDALVVFENLFPMRKINSQFAPFNFHQNMLHWKLYGIVPVARMT